MTSTPTDTAPPSTTPSSSAPTLRDAFRQPRAVWAIAFAATVSFMGIGLVDPILPAISEQLEATPSQAMLLFTSYLFITAIAMFFTSWFASAVGVKRTLLIGLALVVLFAALASGAGSVNEIIGLRAGWGLGNALFISTALAAIVGATAGPSGGAIILYETALGIGMALGPLLGGLLGSVSWRAPFAGTAVLMGIGLLAIALLLQREAKPAHVSPLAALKALGNPALRTLALTAIFYNFGFFTLLAYSPFPLEAAAAARGGEFGAMGIGGVFFGWGVALAITSVFVAPVLTRRLGLIPTLLTTLGLLAVLMLALALVHTSMAAMITLIVIGGLLLGIMNTALTETVMEATDLPRGVASSAYSGVRFLGGAIAPAVAGPLAAATTAGAPYLLAALTLVLSMAMLVIGRRHLASVGQHHSRRGPGVAVGFPAGDVVGPPPPPPPDDRSARAPDPPDAPRRAGPSHPGHVGAGRTARTDPTPPAAGPAFPSPRFASTMVHVPKRLFRAAKRNVTGPVSPAPETRIAATPRPRIDQEAPCRTPPPLPGSTAPASAPCRSSGPPPRWTRRAPGSSTWASAPSTAPTPPCTRPGRSPRRRATGASSASRTALAASSIRWPDRTGSTPCSSSPTRAPARTSWTCTAASA
jgi:predicted MFS family arabinose efflux permease